MIARRAPGPLLLVGTGAIALAFSVDHPTVLVALAAGALVLYFGAPRRASRLYLAGGAAMALGLVILAPIVSGEGDLILFRLPAIPILDGEVTLEEVVAGLVAGVRVFAVAVLVGALLAQMDPDRLQALAARLAPRSALVCALAARLLPTLERDARAIAETARLRGLDLTVGPRRERARRAAPLVLPLVGSSLERGLDAAEAMAARGYGAGPRTRPVEPPWTGAERATAALGLSLCGLAAVCILTGAVDYAFYPTLADPWSAAPLAVAAGAWAALAAVTALTRR
jgi:energy-coupling factor transporter transmembrane protein EcfT